MLLLALFALQLLSVKADDVCKPVTWLPDGASEAAPSSDNSTTTIPRYPALDLITTGELKPGEIRCRYATETRKDVNRWTCAWLAERYHITLDFFFTLNPSLGRDCSNIRPETAYCVKGFIEPLRSPDGRCGPLHNNATCTGTTHGLCCNVDTWTCGSEPADCDDGTCYEGACLGDKVYSTDGTCGLEHGGRQCAGRWGDCCRRDGQCGTGEDFCAAGRCQSGNCTPYPAPPPMVWGNSTDGSCGGPNRYTCDNVLGPCCGKNGRCGVEEAHCGPGCQPEFGECDPRSPPTFLMTYLSSTRTVTLPLFFSTSSTSTSQATISPSTGPSCSSTSNPATLSTAEPTTSSTSETLPSLMTTDLKSLPSCG
ncbi:uncharacterized protein B0I36DRAFT_294999 [Microdochium trichocladiopsis]|uniref:Chitin-binding type-1 domain-containing protein n=1 Tax=Microdochium trichocladiopsis TaxID=1682393 RepID=A0A9P9BPC2_9PEZI|nr:uncharacterized protein B0I36DRAFT_294999 [Microdochium trichocladiopsis]KAH7024401.1 hypothetical protein B0I36DRAFT_294999 [Microdochium trichocladiopsis]